MSDQSLWRVTRTLIIGALGAMAAAFLGIPAAPLIGAAVVTSIAAWSGVRLEFDTRLRDLGFLIIGVSLGSGFDHENLAHIREWGLSLILLLVSVVMTLQICAAILQFGFHYDRRVSVLASSPGSLSVALVLAAEGDRDPTPVMILQSMRLLILAAIIPLLLAGSGVAHFEAVQAEAFSPIVLLALLLAGYALALLMKRFRFPAYMLIGGMLASATAHLLGIVEGRPPLWAWFIGFTLTGTLIGSRFNGVTPAEISKYALASLSSVGVALLIALGFALLATKLTNLPFGQILVSYAPGGVEAMAAIGLAMGFDAGFVAIHHLLRISFLAFFLPAMTPK